MDGPGWMDGCKLSGSMGEWMIGRLNDDWVGGGMSFMDGRCPGVWPGEDVMKQDHSCELSSPKDERSSGTVLRLYTTSG